MRQLLVMSPQAFQGYGSSPAVAGRAPPLASPPPPPPNCSTRKAEWLLQHESDAATTALLIKLPFT